MTYEEALVYLDAHMNREAVPGDVAGMKLDSMARAMELMGEPQHQYPVIHLTGTNGKTSTARVITALLDLKGLSVGTYTSPHLQRVNERISWNGEPISDAAFAEVVSSLTEIEPLLGMRPSWFELVTMAAFRWFADVAVDAAVVEVGLGGRFDATNVADGRVAVVTNVGIDHVEYIGPTRADIAREKAGIVKDGSILILGETDPEITALFRDAPSPAAAIWQRGDDFACDATVIAHGGRLLDVRAPSARYEDLYVPLHGAYQGDNVACAIAAAEAFFGAPLEADLVAEACASVRSPGRMEIVSRRPLMILDGAHNPAGARAAATTIEEEFAGITGRVLVVGLLQGKDPAEMLAAIGADRARLVVACRPPSPRALPPSEVAEAAAALGVATEVHDDVAAALSAARAAAGPDDLVLVTGTLYLVGAARSVLT